ncbi:MAG: hypothetical protein AAF415_18625 [Pseudomonadota bacterium]
MDKPVTFDPRSYPDDGPILDAWGDHYQHAFIALHPFMGGHRKSHPCPIAWSEVAHGLGSPRFPDFALAVCLAANGMDGTCRPDADRQLISKLMKFVEEQDLRYPIDAMFPLAWCAIFHGIFHRMGAAEVIANDYITIGDIEVTVPLADFQAARLPRETRAVIDPFNRLIITSFPMDTYASIVGLTHEAFEITGNDLPLEGFFAGPSTTSSWVNEPGTYSYDGWLS